MPVDEAAIPDGLPGEVFDVWGQLAESDGLIPYLDYATPTFYDDISGAIQQLLAGRQDPAAFTSGVESAFRKFADAQ